MELLKALQAESYELKTAHIGNALVLRAYRYSVFPDARLIERRSEMNEGLAEYTGMTYAGYTNQEQFDNYESAIKRLEKSQMEAGYPYVSGSLYAFLNDEKDDTWRAQIPERSVDEITGLIYDIEIDKDKELVVEGLLGSSEYNYISPLFSLNTSEGLRKMFSRNRLILLSKGSSFQLRSNVIVTVPEMGTVYNNVEISNEWGVLKVEESGRVLIKDLEIVLNTDSVGQGEHLIRGKGWQLKINDGWRIDNRDDDQYLIKSKD